MNTSRARPRVFVLHGAPGVGKTALLHELVHRCRHEGIATQFTHGLIAREAHGTGAGTRLLARLSELPNGAVMFVDGLEELDRGHREFLEGAVAVLPADALLVASRGSPPPAHRSTPDLQLVELSPLTENQCEGYLRERGIPDEQMPALIRVSAGNPLRLTLAVDALTARPTLPPADLALCVDHEVVARVCSCHLSAGHVATLDLAALVPVLSKELLDAALARMVPAAMTDGLFQWLARRGFGRDTCRGLRLHSELRTAWLSVARARRRPQIAELTRVARDFYMTRLHSGVDWDEAVATLLYLDGERPIFHPVAPAPKARSYIINKASAEEASSVLELFEDAEATTADAALDADIGLFELCRDADGELLAVLGLFELPRDEAAFFRGAASDSALARIASFLAEHSLAANEAALIVRWFFATASSQPSGPALSTVRERIGQRMLRSDPLAYVFQVKDVEDGVLPVDSLLTLRTTHLGQALVEGSCLDVMVHWVRGCSTAALFSAAAGRPRAVPTNTRRSVVGEGQSLEQIVEGKLATLADESGLTPREQEVLHLLILGRSVDEIALALGIRPRTAKFHQANVLTKLGLESRLELFRMLL